MINCDNPYYKTNHNLYNVPESQFLDYLQREGTVVKDYWTDSEYQCFFRRNKDTNQTNDNISIYYPVDNGIRPGSLITSYGKTYLILNQESLENRVYRRSDGLNADVMLSTYNKDTMQDISVPCFAYDSTGIIPESGEIMKVVSGNVELMTGDNDMSRKLSIGCKFNAMGNWYEIGNINFKTGIARVGASIIQGSSNLGVYSLTITAKETYIQGETAKLSASPTIDDNPVANATLTWSSSNPDIITVAKNGEARFVGIGTCSISCHWKEHNITETTQVEVIAEPVVVELSCEINGDDAIFIGSSADFTAMFYQADGVAEDSTITPVWSLDIASGISKYVLLTDPIGNEITIEISNTSAVVGKSFVLKLSDTDERYHTTKVINIISWL